MCMYVNVYLKLLHICELTLIVQITSNLNKIFIYILFLVLHCEDIVAHVLSYV